ncbi:MAG: helix-turn-helix domain-containing protein [Thermocrispum sp.]
MPGPRSPLADRLSLTDAERHELEHRRRCTTIAAGQRDRAAIILLLADGQSVSATARRVGVGRRIVRKWGDRFARNRLTGLADQPRAGRPPVFPPPGDRPSRPPRLRAAGPARPLPLAVGLPGTGAPGGE